MKSLGVTSVLLLALVLASPSAGEAQFLRPSELCSDHPDAAIVAFEDASLELRVRAAWSLGAEDDLTCRLVAGLTRLGAGQAGIESLGEIQTLTGLDRLRLGSNSITDLSALGGLTRLTGLGLVDNSITDISALDGITSLESLDLNDRVLRRSGGAISSRWCRRAVAWPVSTTQPAG